MLAIYKRELKSYFTTMIGYVFVAVTLFLIGIFFFAYNLYQERPYFSYTIQACTLVLIVTVPFLTMRLLSEERKTKTDQLILTSPVSVFSIVMGKFLAAFTVFVIPCLISCIYPLILRRFGTVPMSESYVSILGFILYGAACISIGMFFSSIVENQIIAAIITFFALFLGFMMASFASLITSKDGFVTTLFGLFDISTPLNYMTNGVIDITSMIYYCTLTVLFVFLTVQSIEKRRYTITKKNFTKCAFNIIGIVVAIAVYVAINIFVGKIPEKYTSIDCSYSGIFSLTQQTKEYLASLESDVNLYVLCAREDYDDYVIKTLDNYESESKHVKVEYIDPMVYPRFYLKYTDTMPSAGSIIAEGIVNTMIIDYSNMYEFDYSNYYYTGSPEMTGFDGEGQINSAIDYVSNGNMPTVFIIEGHGESDLGEEYYKTFDKANVQYGIVNLMDCEVIPSEVSGIIINGAVNDISSDDLRKLTDYLDNGGKMMITLALTENKQDNLEELLDYMEIKEIKGLVVENNPNYYYYYPNYLRPDVATIQYTDGLPNYAIIPDALALMIGNEDSYVSYEPFLVTTEDAFIKFNYMDSMVFNEKEGDYEGPFTVGVEARRQVSGDDGIITNPLMIVFSSSGMFTTEMDEYVSNTNLIMFSNIVSSFVDKGVGVAVPSKMFSLPYLTITSGSRNVLSVITIFLIPVGVIAYGIFVCMKRRRY